MWVNSWAGPQYLGRCGLGKKDNLGHGGETPGWEPCCRIPRVIRSIMGLHCFRELLEKRRFRARLLYPLEKGTCSSKPEQAAKFHMEKWKKALKKYVAETHYEGHIWRQTWGSWPVLRRMEAERPHGVEHQCVWWARSHGTFFWLCLLLSSLTNEWLGPVTSKPRVKGWSLASKSLLLLWSSWIVKHLLIWFRLDPVPFRVHS